MPHLRAGYSPRVTTSRGLRNVAVVLAGGTGTRVGFGIPKQLIKIAGKPIIEHTIAAMQASAVVDEIIVMMVPGYLDEVRAIVRGGGYTKVSQILEGAGTRNDSTRAALAALGEASATYCCTTQFARWSPRPSLRPTSRRWSTTRRWTLPSRRPTPSSR